MYLAGGGTKLGPLIVVLGVGKGKLNLSQHEVISLVHVGVGAENHLLNGVVFPGRLLAVGEPLDSKGRPLKEVADDEIVEERSVPLPGLVLFVDQSLLDLFLRLLVVSRHFRRCFVFFPPQAEDKKPKRRDL